MRRSTDTTDLPCETPALLRLLDKAVRSDLGRSGLQGRVAFAVETAERVWWWSCVFYNGYVETAVVDNAPADSHASIVLGDRRACDYMGVPCEGTSDRLTVRGNKPLLDRFLNRYVKPCSPLQARLRYQSGTF